MCVSSGPATFSNTLLYAAETTHPKDSKRVHVLGYQNNVENRMPGANCMILPIPAMEAMGPENLINTQSCKQILKDLVESVRPRSRGFMLGGTPKGFGFQVFESGDYTVVLATDPSTIPKALQFVPQNKRPTIGAELLKFYEERYAGWHIAICCFSNEQMPNPDPLLWWYVPMNPEVLYAPAIDAHDGRAPDLNQQVSRDHEVVFGTSGSGWYKAPSGLQWMFPGKYSLTSLTHATPNKDFILPISEIHSHHHKTLSWTKFAR